MISVQVRNIYDVKQTAAKVRQSLGSSYTTVDWQDANRPLFTALALERRIGIVIIALIILIAALNITTTLILVVMERRRDIAILNALGASGRNIMSIFVIEGAIVGVLGAVIESCSAPSQRLLRIATSSLGLPADVYSISNVPLHPTFRDMAPAALVAVALSIIATIYPSQRGCGHSPGRDASRCGVKSSQCQVQSPKSKTDACKAAEPHESAKATLHGEAADIGLWTLDIGLERGTSDFGLIVSDLRKSFSSPGDERIEVLRGVSFSATAGECVAIMGSSGAGKSTLLHLLGGLEAADHGTIVAGEFAVDAANRSALARFRNDRVGFIFQFHHLLPDLTAAENVSLPLMIARTHRPEAIRRASQALEAIGLGGRVSHLVGNLSGVNSSGLQFVVL